MNLEKLIISTSPITGAIYAGLSDDGGKTFSRKIDVTKQTVNAVMMHMDLTRKDYECAAGELNFKPREVSHD
ncbi:hypothetical protein QYF50_18810 [Paenibacillus vini]|uniref:DUF7446 family protein n=1 Tax=Paenibacillus vini TaxID=1476024 RepID=UPI0025B73188|nr:hypothetical protein [Paenibacillus vini]MDN4069957.1 hypothetical protein [Paenibacillus vini]